MLSIFVNNLFLTGSFIPGGGGSGHGNLGPSMRLNVVACLKLYSVVFPNIFDADKYISAPSPSFKYSMTLVIIITKLLSRK